MNAAMETSGNLADGELSVTVSAALDWVLLVQYTQALQLHCSAALRSGYLTSLDTSTGALKAPALSGLQGIHLGDEACRI